MNDIRNIPAPVTLEAITEKLLANTDLTHNTEDKNQVPQFAGKIYQILQTVQFDTLSPQHKSYILSGIQRTFTQEWKLQAYQALES